MNMLELLRKDLRGLADPAKARLLQGFFKTGKGQYGEGDVFLGVMVPQQRKLVRQYAALDLADLAELLAGEIHEERLIALLILVQRFRKADDRERRRIYEFYMKHRLRINNWDLVDLSAPLIVGPYLDGKDTGVLDRLARSRKCVWLVNRFCKWKCRLASIT